MARMLWKMYDILKKYMVCDFLTDHIFFLICGILAKKRKEILKMCGIVGYMGDKNAADVLIYGLEKLEYRGYDSAGISIIEGNTLITKKSAGKLENLKKIIPDTMNGTLGIGHTRWATHGKPTSLNSHPFTSKDGVFSVVHNGIIENYTMLKKHLKNHGFEFESQTDSEVIAHLLELNYEGDFEKTVRKTVNMLSGSFALGIISKKHPDVLIAAKKASPMIIGKCNKEWFIASDVLAIGRYTNLVCSLEDNEIAVIKKDSIKFEDFSGREISKEFQQTDINREDSSKNGYKHFMLKEIYEQPMVVLNTINSIIMDKRIIFDCDVLKKENLTKYSKIFIVACGTSYHVGVAGKYIIEKLCSLPVEAVHASEFIYADYVISKDHLVIFISQSGETKDTLSSVEIAKEKGATTLSIVNVEGSALSKKTDDVIYTKAGVEIAVASTKAYSTQLIIIYMIAMHLSESLNKLEKTQYLKYINEILSLPDKLTEVLKTAQKIKKIASEFFNYQSMFFIGRNLDYAASMEGSLKLKEISYIPSEAYPAGELKHGTISLVDSNTLVVATVLNSSVREKTMSNIEEVRARGAKVVVIMNGTTDEISADYIIKLPKCADLFSPSLSVIPMQLFAYYVALSRGCEIDMPKNLAKSVTVE